jgi:predicted esterase
MSEAQQLNEARQHHLAVTRTARYFTLGEATDQGQLAARFLRRFRDLASPTRLIVAPEGLSRFYVDGAASQQVGAAWMTREDRLNEIEDYVNFLNQVYREIFQQLDRSRVRVRALGFSQGVATVCRWLNRGQAIADELIIWSGEMPIELDEHGNWALFQKMAITLVLGTRDQYAFPGFIDKQRAILTRHDVAHRFVPFDGEHVLDEATLATLV